MSSSSSDPSSAPGTQTKGLMTSQQIRKLVESVNPEEQLDAQVEELLLEIADDFVENVASFSCMLAKHRNSRTLEVKDVQLHLEKHWNIRIPGFSDSNKLPPRKPPISELHRKRLALARKSMARDANRAQKKRKQE